MEGNNKLSEKQPAPTGTLTWVGFGCAVFALACLCVSFASPFWMQTWPMSENRFRNIGLWHVCFYKYMHHKDDSQELYNGCWWVFDTEPKYYKLREWLLPPWFISCQVLVTGCLLVEITTCLVMALIFLHCCPILNHEYMQTYGAFAAASMMFLVTMIAMVVAIVFAVQSQDWYWMPRPDQNFLSWGYGFYIISAIFTLVSGVLLFKEAWKTYDELLLKEDEYTKAALEMSGYPMDTMYPRQDMEYNSYQDHGYDQQQGYGAPQYGDVQDDYVDEKPPLQSYEPGYASSYDYQSRPSYA